MLSELIVKKAAESRSISPENPTGERGGGARKIPPLEGHAASELGEGWKVSPYVQIQPGEKMVLAEIEGPASISHIWVTSFPDHWRNLIFRVFWDEEAEPSIETPLGDFFCNGWGERCSISSIPIAVNPAGGFNSYWTMPFRKRARIEMENRGFKKATVYYQVDYEITPVAADALYFHAQFRRTNPLPYMEEYTIVDKIKGGGHYVGTYMAWGVNNNGWWGEGEVKMFIDGDQQYPTICGTGTEDYFGGAWNFEQTPGQYDVFSNLYSGMPQVLKPDGLYRANTRFGLYRWHILDPIRFNEDFKVRIQALGWRSQGRFLPLQDDLSSVAFWYQNDPHVPFPTLPDRNYLEVI